MPKRKNKETEGVVLCLAHVDGRLASATTKKLLRGTTSDLGYRLVNIDAKIWRVHRIIALGFMLQRKGLITAEEFMKWQIDHVTGDLDNNLQTFN